MINMDNNSYVHVLCSHISGLTRHIDNAVVSKRSNLCLYEHVQEKQRHVL